MESYALLLAATLNAGTVLAIAALGLLINEKAGIVNLGAEGMMLCAAIAGFATVVHTGSSWMGFAAGAGAGALLSETRGCVACHGSPGMPPTNALTPALHGQTQQMLRNALQNYAKGTRASGIMQPVASQLTADEIQTLAQEYADAKATAVSSSSSTSTEVIS